MRGLENARTECRDKSKWRLLSSPPLLKKLKDWASEYRYTDRYFSFLVLPNVSTSQMASANY